MISSEIPESTLRWDFKAERSASALRCMSSICTGGELFGDGLPVGVRLELLVDGLHVGWQMAV